MEEPPEGVGAPPALSLVPAPANPPPAPAPDAPSVAPIPAVLAAELVSATQKKENPPPETSFDVR